MNNAIRVHGALDLKAGAVFNSGSTVLPANPRPGTIIDYKGDIIVYRIDDKGVGAWQPLLVGSETATYRHSQAALRSVWTVTHNLNSADLWYIVKDADGNVIQGFSETLDASDPLNKFTLTFATPITGTVFIVAAVSFTTPRLIASEIVVGDIKLDSAGFHQYGKLIDLSTIVTLDQVYTQTQVDNLIQGVANTAATASQTATTASTTANTAKTTADSAASVAASAAAAVASAQSTASNAQTTANAAKTLAEAAATTVYVDNKVASAVTGLVGTAPAVLDTINELAAALGNNPNFAVTVTTSIATAQAAADAANTLAASKLSLNTFLSNWAFYDLGGGSPEVVSIGLVVADVPVARKIQIPVNFAGSYCRSRVAATAATQLSVRVNGTQIGTINFAVGATAGTFSALAAAVVINPGQWFEVIALSADATLAGVSLTVRADAVA